MGASDLLQEERWTAEPRRGHRGIKQRLVNTAFKESPKESKTHPAEIERPRKDQFSQWLSELMQYTTIIKKKRMATRSIYHSDSQQPCGYSIHWLWVELPNERLLLDIQYCFFGKDLLLPSLYTASNSVRPSCKTKAFREKYKGSLKKN